MLKLLAYLVFILGVHIWRAKGGCRTVASSEKDSLPCIFPFFYNNRIYDKCTSSDGDDPWCATKLTERIIQGKIKVNSTMSAWGYCSSNCPGVVTSTRVLNVAPENAVGKCSCGVMNSRYGLNRIVGGEEVQPGAVPWQVALLTNPGDPQTHFCGGTLVGDQYVITAAHCTHNLDKSRIQVLIGASSLGVANETTRFFRGLQKLNMHPDYRRFYNGSDIAVLKLDAPVDIYSYPNIKPACLPVTIERKDLFEKTAVVSGWGRNATAGPFIFSNLRKVPLKIREDCGRLTMDAVSIGFNMTDRLCANDVNKNACKFDSGGPLVFEDFKDNNGAYTIVGAVNGGGPCNADEYPGTFVDVTWFIKWVREQMPDLRTCPPPST